MKIAIVILVFISVAWARTLTETVKDDLAKKLEELMEDKTLIVDLSRSDTSDELDKLQDSDILNGEMNDLSFGVEGDGSGGNPPPNRKPGCRGRCPKLTRKPSGKRPSKRPKLSPKPRRQ